MGLTPNSHKPSNFVLKQPPEMFYKKCVLKNFAKFTWNHQYQSLFFNKVACNFITTETLAQVISCEFCEIFKNNFFTEYLWWMLLFVQLWENAKHNGFYVLTIYEMINFTPSPPPPPKNNFLLSDFRTGRYNLDMNFNITISNFRTNFRAPPDYFLILIIFWS